MKETEIALFQEDVYARISGDESYTSAGLWNLLTGVA